MARVTPGSRSTKPGFSEGARSAAPAPPEPSPKKAYSHGDKIDSVNAHAQIEKAISRLNVIIDEETAALRAKQPIDLKEFNNRKSLGLFELQNALRGLNGKPPAPETRLLFDQLNVKLEENQYLLKIHLEAVHEITSIISDTIKQADSDGTYTLTFRSKDPPHD